jgi:cytidylate kinase
MAAPDARVIDSTSLTLEQVIQTVVDAVKGEP